jgi:hypothetical protein
MRKSKFIALLLAVTMLVLSLGGASVAAAAAPFNATQPGLIPDDEWALISVYHWVVRGETLAGIANRYGTTVEEIIFKNQEYFTDLTMRNITTGVNVQLEHGVRLFIYHMARVVHYVQRGDTLAGLANGDLRWGLFTLRTTEQDIINQNPQWFRNLADLNKTRDTAHTLEESYGIWDTVNNTPVYNGEHRMNFLNNQRFGTPLVIAVPVHAVPDPILGSEYLRERWTYMANQGEREGNPNLTNFTPWQVPFRNAMPTNEYLQVSSGWLYLIGFRPEIMRVTNYAIPGWWQRTVTWWGA